MPSGLWPAARLPSRSLLPRGNLGPSHTTLTFLNPPPPKWMWDERGEGRGEAAGQARQGCAVSGAREQMSPGRGLGVAGRDPAHQ